MHIVVLHIAVARNFWPAFPELEIAVTDTTAVFAQVVSELVESARNNDYTDVIMIHEHRGEPDGLVVCHLPYGPSAYFGIFNTVLVPLGALGTAQDASVVSIRLPCKRDQMVCLPWHMTTQYSVMLCWLVCCSEL